MLEGNPGDDAQVGLSLKRHEKMFGEAPELLSGDRGFFSQDVLEDCHKAAVVLACIPQCGGKKTPSAKPLRRARPSSGGNASGQASRGAFGSVSRPRHEALLAEGRERFELLIGAAVLANNLMAIARLLLSKRHRRRVAA